MMLDTADKTTLNLAKFFHSGFFSKINNYISPIAHHYYNRNKLSNTNQPLKRETKMILFVQMSVTQLKKIVARFTG
jgi:hypothetical protein